MTMTENLTKQSFLEKVFNYEKNKDWVYEGKLPAIIDFYADWCGPCKMIAPVLEELSDEYSGKINIYKVDTEAEQELAAAFAIRSIPSMLFIPMNEPPQMANGALPKQELHKLIKEVLRLKFKSFCNKTSKKRLIIKSYPPYDFTLFKTRMEAVFPFIFF